MKFYACPHCGWKLPPDQPTLRDQFAMAAVAGNNHLTTGLAARDAVRVAYEIADMMLQERAKP